jgi:hypothetical protein
MIETVGKEAAVDVQSFDFAGGGEEALRERIR